MSFVPCVPLTSIFQSPCGSAGLFIPDFESPESASIFGYLFAAFLGILLVHSHYAHINANHRSRLTLPPSTL